MATPQSSWLKPCCGRRATTWHVFLLSAAVNSFLVACVILVAILMTVELLIDTKLLQFSNALQCSGIIHWISLSILSMFFVETVLRIIILGIWNYIENKVEVLDGAVIVLSLAPMVASTVANGPSSPWDAISLFISLRIWRVKRIIEAYVLPVKVEMDIVVQQYEKTKLIQEEQLERLTQMCQEQAFEIRQLRAHLAQQDLDLVAERERALKLPHDLQNKTARFKVVSNRDSDEEATENLTELSHEMIMKDDMNKYINQYYNEPSSESGVPGTCIITTTAIDVHHHPNLLSDMYSVEVPLNPEQSSSSSSITSRSVSRSPESSETLAQSISSQVFCSSTDCSTREESTDYCPLAQNIRNTVNKAVVQELLSSLSDDTSLIQKGHDPANLHLSSPVGLHTASPRKRLNIYNRVNCEGYGMFSDRSVIPLNRPLLENKHINAELK